MPFLTKSKITIFVELKKRSLNWFACQVIRCVQQGNVYIKQKFTVVFQLLLQRFQTVILFFRSQNEVVCKTVKTNYGNVFLLMLFKAQAFNK